MTTKREVVAFVSYAHADDEVATEFIIGLKEMLLPSAKYAYVFWQDKNILPGENWHQEIQNALSQCSMGIVLVSPALLGSKYVSAHELPAIMNRQTALLIPVMLRKVNFERHDLKGLKESQIFQRNPEELNGARSYAQCGTHQKYDFVFDLFGAIEARLDKTGLLGKQVDQ